MTLAEALHSIATHPDADPAPEAVAALREAAERYPFCAIPQALLLRFGLVDADRLDAVRASVAVLTADKQALASIVVPPDADPATFYPPEPGREAVGTDSAIDTFLSTYGQTSPEEEALLERLIFNPVPDYAELLEAESTEPATAPEPQGQDAVIDAFLRRDEATPPHVVAEEPPVAALPQEPAKPTAAAADADTSLSESLARVFITRGSYSRALEIISDLAARFPDKNPFYADQIRYLRKLVALQSLTAR